MSLAFPNTVLNTIVAEAIVMKTEATPAAPATPGGGASTPTNTAPGAAPSSG